MSPYGVTKPQFVNKYVAYTKNYLFGEISRYLYKLSVLKNGYKSARVLEPWTQSNSTKVLLATSWLKTYLYYFVVFALIACYVLRDFIRDYTWIIRI